MTQLWALITDSFRESMASKIFWVVLGLSGVTALAMACISFTDHSVVVLFGAWEIEWNDMMMGVPLSRETLISLVVYGITDNLLGGLGVLLTIIATASFFPAFLERGGLEVVLAKPISRPALFLAKYLGSMVFILVQAAVFVLLTFLVAGLRWGVWMPGFLWVIPLTVLLFSYLYCISVWVAVRTRSTLAAVLLTLAAWVVITGLQLGGAFFEAYPEWKSARTVYNGVRVAQWVLPKPQDVTYIAARWSGAISPDKLVPDRARNASKDPRLVDAAGQIDKARVEKSPWPSILSSLGFEAAVVLLAMWHFSRKDY